MDARIDGTECRLILDVTCGPCVVTKWLSKKTSGIDQVKYGRMSIGGGPVMCRYRSR